MKDLLNTLVILLFTSIACWGQNFGKVDSLAETLRETYKLRGVGIVAVANNEVVYQNSFGKANAESDLSDSTRLYIASNTKAFVGLAMAKLKTDKRIAYSDPISKYIPASYFPNGIEVDNITIGSLLQHTHGLSNDPLVFRTAYSGEYPTDLRELLRHTVYRLDTFSVEFKYSNLGYLLCGLIIEAVTEMSWRDYLKEALFDQIGMTETNAHADFNQTLEVMPYEHYSDEPISSRKSDNTLHAAGGVYTTLGDMTRWLRLFTGDKVGPFHADVMKCYLETRTPVGKRMGPFAMNEYGNGWIYGALMDQKLYFHFGSFPGYESLMSFSPDNKTGVFVFVNERIGGQRVAAMLSAYIYMILNDDKAADQKIKMFSQFIDPLYSKESPNRKPYTYQSISELTGTYLSPKYGQLIVDKNVEGYTFSLGRLSSLAYEDSDNNGILIEWTPGIMEQFSLERAGDTVKLIYGDYGEFIKQ